MAGYGAADYLSFGSTGEISVGAAATQGPDVGAKAVLIKAREANAGQVYISDADTVTVTDGTTDATTGFELGAGDDTGWIPVPSGNLSGLWFIGSDALQDVTYMTLI